MASATEERLEQKVKIEEVGPALKQIEITIPESRINEKLNENFRQLRSEAALPGFRAGKAPLALLKKRFGEDVRKEVTQQLVGESYSQVIEEEGIRPISDPDIQDVENLELPESGDLSVTIKVEILPEFELPDFSKIEVKKPVFEVTDEVVAEEIERYCNAYGQLADVEGAEADIDDYLKADVTVESAEGEAISSDEDAMVYVPGETRKFKGMVGGMTVDDLGNKLKGAKAGDSIELKETGNENNQNEAIAGKEVKITVAVKAVQRQKPLAKEDLMQQLGFENEEDMTAQVSQSIEQRNEGQQRQAMQQQVAEQLANEIDFDLPENLTERQVEQVAQRQAMQLMYQGVTSPEEIQEKMEEIKKDSAEDATRELKLFFILGKIAEDNEIEVSQGELNGQISMMAAQQGQRPEAMRKQMQDSGRLQELYVQIRDAKAIDHIIEQAKVEEISGEAWTEEQKAKAEAKEDK